jgi:hypothetical protein
MTYQNPATGQTQQVAERENAKRRILEAAGWKPVKLVDVTSHDSTEPEYIAVPLDVPPVPPEQPRKRGRKAAPK